MINIDVRVPLVFVALLLLTTCKKQPVEPIANPDFLIFPLGRSFLSHNTVAIKTNDKVYSNNFIFDSCGGYWLKLPTSELSDNEKIKITFTRKNGTLDLFSEAIAPKYDWTRPSYYIDSDNENIVLKAIELTKGLSTNVDKAKAIQQFMVNNVVKNDYRDSFLDKASRTYDTRYGTCMNFSRLYVALCRAVKIPSRTVWGVVYGYNNDSIYDYHHQWAEILDESGQWHPCDFTYTHNFDLNDIRYLDLIYAAEENSMIKNRDQESSLVMFEYLKYFNDYPVTLTARLGFQLRNDQRPDSMVVEYFYQYNR
jgi:hypothetical protein